MITVKQERLGDEVAAKILYDVLDMIENKIDRDILNPSGEMRDYVIERVGSLLIDYSMGMEE